MTNTLFLLKAHPSSLRKRHSTTLVKHCYTALTSPINTNSKNSFLLYWVSMERCWQWGGCRGNLCEKRPRVASMPDTASSCLLCNGSTTGHSYAHQASWWHLHDLTQNLLCLKIEKTAFLVSPLNATSPFPSLFYLPSLYLL